MIALFQALRVLDNAMDTIVDAPDSPKSGWAMLESEASGGWSMRAFAHLVYGLRKVPALLLEPYRCGTCTARSTVLKTAVSALFIVIAGHCWPQDSPALLH